MLSLFRVLLRRRALLEQLIIRDLQDAYMGSALSRWWALLHPLVILSLYLFVFGFVFNRQPGVTSVGTSDFAIFMLPGLCA